MQALMNTNSTKTMTLKEITDLLDVRHNDAMNTVAKMAETPDFGSITKISYMIEVGKGAQRSIETYELNKRQSIAVAARLNVSLLMRIVDRWQELENQQSILAKDKQPELISIEEGKRKLARLKMAANAVCEIARMDKALASMNSTSKSKAVAAAGEHGVDLSDIIEAEQDIYEADVIKYLLRKGKASYRQFQQAKYRVRPWAAITPKSAIGETIRATIDRLEAKGVIIKQDGYIQLLDDHAPKKLTVH